MPQSKLPVQRSGFSFGLILGLIFIFIGAVLLLTLLNVNVPLNLKNAEIFLQYGAAVGSILGGLSMLFKKNSQQIKI